MDYLVNRMVDKLMVGGIVFHKQYFYFYFGYAPSFDILARLSQNNFT